MSAEYWWCDDWFAAYRTAFMSYALSRGLRPDDVAAWLMEAEDAIYVKHWPGEPEHAAYIDVRACEREYSNL
jgi:hypothetical protein